MPNSEIITLHINVGIFLIILNVYCREL